jgi:hypothetical protein
MEAKGTNGKEKDNEPEQKNGKKISGREMKGISS